jgi:hypothetical protein
MRTFDPAREIDHLIPACIDLGQVGRVIIDPIVAVAKGDSPKMPRRAATFSRASSWRSETVQPSRGASPDQA